MNLLRSLNRIARRSRDGALILVYHRVDDCPPDPWSLAVAPAHFDEQLAVLRHEYQPISLARLAHLLRAGAAIPPRAVVVTFDDGYADNFQNGLPLLEKHACPATVFVATGAAGRRGAFWWDELAALLLYPGRLPERLALTMRGERIEWSLGLAAGYSLGEFERDRAWRWRQPPPTVRHALVLQLWERLHPLPWDERDALMDEISGWAGGSSHPQPPGVPRVLLPDEIVRLAAGGLVEIGAHTVHHASLAALPTNMQAEEITGSIAVLENMMGRPVKLFAYPFGKPGDVSADTVRWVEQAGVQAACMNVPGRVTQASDPYRLPRAHVPDLNGFEFRRWLADRFYE